MNYYGDQAIDPRSPAGDYIRQVWLDLMDRAVRGGHVAHAFGQDLAQRWQDVLTSDLMLQAYIQASRAGVNLQSNQISSICEELLKRAIHNVAKSNTIIGGGSGFGGSQSSSLSGYSGGLFGGGAAVDTGHHNSGLFEASLGNTNTPATPIAGASSYVVSTPAPEQVITKRAEINQIVEVTLADHAIATDFTDRVDEVNNAYTDVFKFIVFETKPPAEDEVTNYINLVTTNYKPATKGPVQALEKFVKDNTQLTGSSALWAANITYQNYITFPNAARLPTDIQSKEGDTQAPKGSLVDIFTGINVDTGDKFRQIVTALIEYFGNLPFDTNRMLSPVMLKLLNDQISRYIRLDSDPARIIKLGDIADLHELCFTPRFSHFNNNKGFRKAVWEILKNIRSMLYDIDSPNGFYPTGKLLAELIFDDDFRFAKSLGVTKQQVFGMDDIPRKEFVTKLTGAHASIVTRNSMLLANFIDDDIWNVFEQYSFVSFVSKDKFESKWNSLFLSLLSSPTHHLSTPKTIVMKDSNDRLLVLKQGKTLSGLDFVFKSSITELI